MRKKLLTYSLLLCVVLLPGYFYPAYWQQIIWFLLAAFIVTAFFTWGNFMFHPVRQGQRETFIYAMILSAAAVVAYLVMLVNNY